MTSENHEDRQRAKLSALDELAGHQDLALRLRDLADEVEKVIRAGDKLESIEIAELIEADDRAMATRVVIDVGPVGDDAVRATRDTPASTDPKDDTWNLPWAAPAPAPWLSAPSLRAVS